MQMSKPSVSGKGFALPLVLIVIALLAVLSMGLSQMARNRMADLQLRKDIWANEKVAQDIVHQSVYAMLVGQYSERDLLFDGNIIPLDGRPFKWGAVELQIQDEAGLMSLAFYNRKMFNRLLNKLTDSKTASRISAELADWIDEDNTRQFGGMEAANYISEGLLQSPRNAPIRSLSELLELPSMTIELFNGESGSDGLVDLLAAGGSDFFNVATAPDRVLAPVLGLSKGAETRLLSYKKQGDWSQVTAMVDSHPWLFDGLSPLSHGNRYRFSIKGSEGRAVKARVLLSPYREDRLFSLVDWRAPHYKSE